MLFEDWGNLTRVTPNIVKGLTYRNKSSMGRNSKVEIFKGTPEQVWDKINDKSKSDRGELLAVIVRYEQDDILGIRPDWRGVDFTKGEFLDMIPNYHDGYDYIQGSAKSSSGLKKVIKSVADKIQNYVEKEKTNIFGIPQTATFKDILARFNYQFIYADIERDNIRHNRIENQGGSDSYFNKDGVKVVSNFSMNKDSLSYRLKEYINNKLPSFDNPADIPTDIQKFNSKSAFKLYGCKYEYSSWKPSRYEPNTLDFIQGREPDYIIFVNKDQYSSKFSHYPDKIVFRLMFNPKQKDVEVTDIGYELRRKEYKEIFGKEPIIINQINSRQISDDDYAFAPIDTLKQYIDSNYKNTQP